MILRALSAALTAALVAVGFIALPRESAAQETDLLNMTSTVTYDVKTSDSPIGVAWDVTLVNNDPDTAFSDEGQIFFYDALAMPVLRGAAGAAATDGNGNPLTVVVDDPGAGSGVAVRATVDFAEPLFFGETYSFRMTYSMPNDARSEGILITPFYAFLPAIAAGDQSTVIVNTPSGEPWEVSVEAQGCEAAGNTFTCSGEETGYLAAIVEVSQPSATSTVSFDVQMDATVMSVDLRFFQGEDAAAAHQQQLITAGLPVIEDLYGTSYDGPPLLNVAHGGRQAVFGYEGLASCTRGDRCDVVISPIADDYTVLHELAHLWSDLYAKRWLAEGFAELISHEAALQLPDLVQGLPPRRPQADVLLQLDDWGDPESLIGADEEQLKTATAGYDYSLRFMDELREDVGFGTLQSLNRELASGGTPADSRLYMDLLEDASGRNLDFLFVLWVFGDEYETILADRREAKDRLASLTARFEDRDLPLDITDDIAADIRAWAFDFALAALDEAEANLETYAELLTQINTLELRAQQAGLVLPESVGDDLDEFQFETVRTALSLADDAVDAYASAEEAVDGDRSAWERFGLLGSDPDGTLTDARETFERGDFERSQEHSQDAEDLIADASSVAFKRMLVVAAFFGLLVLALLVAFAVSRLRERELAKD